MSTHIAKLALAFQGASQIIMGNMHQDYIDTIGAMRTLSPAAATVRDTYRRLCNSFHE